LTPSEQRKAERKYKVSFSVRSGHVNVSTIHSFKGYEVANVFVLFDPNKQQRLTEVELLYTAVTRTQSKLSIFTADVRLTAFSKNLYRMGLINVINDHNPLRSSSSPRKIA
jgi:superfamily I DNA/RNA helicase